MATVELLGRWVAVDNVCAWPNLTLLGDGTVGAFIHNRPSHGKMEADIELWVSKTGEGPWELRSTVTAHESGTTRMNHSAGISPDDMIIALYEAPGENFSFGQGEAQRAKAIAPA